MGDEHVPPLRSGDEPVTLITTFRLRKEAPHDRFVDLWTGIGNIMASRSGFISARLYRAVDEDASGEYIQVAKWRDPALLAAAQSDPEIQWMEKEVNNLVVNRRHLLCNASSEEIVPPS